MKKTSVFWFLVSTISLAGCGERFIRPIAVPTRPASPGAQTVSTTPASEPVKPSSPPPPPDRYPQTPEAVVVAYVEACRAGRLEERLNYMEGDALKDSRAALDQLKKDNLLPAAQAEAVRFWGVAAYTYGLQFDRGELGLYFQALLRTAKGPDEFLMGLRKNAAGTWHIFDFARTPPNLSRRVPESVSPVPPRENRP